MKHIEFSQGYYFLDDLQKSQQLPTGQQLEFTYHLNDNLKIDIEKAKQKKIEKEEQSRKEFEDLKKKMEEESQATPNTNAQSSQ